MKPTLFSAWLLFCVMVLSSQTLAFEIPTHRRMSNEAAEASTLGDQLPLLGLTSLDDPVTFLQAADGVKSAREWIRFGAAAEDDSFPDLGTPRLRFRNHFYNPLTEFGLGFSPNFPCSVGGTQDGKPSLEWGLVDSPGQDFSFPDARTYFLKALTETSEADREQNVALLLRALGQLIHLIQDMAQPQHSRNDPHGPWCFGSASSAAFYEAHTTDSLDDLTFTGYGAVYDSTDTTTFNTPGRFWDTATGKGLAEYSNRGFVSSGTNFDTFASGLFPNPDINVAEPIIVDQTALCNRIGADPPLGQDGNPLPCIMTFLRTPVTDQFRAEQSQDNDKTSTFSIFDADLTKFNEQVTYPDPFTGQLITSSRLFTLNTENFDAANEFLIPRAIGYSAGLINYFFRGKIDLVPDPQDVTRVLILNRGDEDMTGTFTLYYDDEQGFRKPVKSWTTGEFAPDSTLAAQNNMSVPRFTIPNDPPPAINGGFTLVFTGEMGAEQPVPPNLPNPSPGAVVAKQIFCSPLFITAGGRLSNAGSGWLFQPDSSVQSGTVDWVWANGCQRFSWQGPFGRYLYPRHTSELADKIFSGGGIVATAPGPVLGVAVQQGADPAQKFLLAVVAEIDEFDRIEKDTVYVTPLDDPTNWVFVGEFDTYSSAETSSRPSRTEYPSHYYFNAAGTQAVSIKRTAKAENLNPESFDENPWRKVIMDVSVTATGSSLGGTASFALSSPQSLDTEGTSSSTSSGTPPNAFFSRQSDIDYRAKSIIADYLGNQLVELHLDVEEHEAANSSFSQEANGMGSTSGSESSRRTVVLRTSLGWSWDLIEVDYVAMRMSQSDPVNEVNLSHRNESTGFQVFRGLEYLDLRFDPPVVAYEERENTDFFLLREINDEAIEEVETHESHERLAWRIAGSRHLVWSADTTDITDTPPQYILLNSGFGLLLGINQAVGTFAEVGTFAVGGPPHQPQVIGAHKNPRIERDFMFPAGNLSAFGGGPVGF